MEIFFKDKKIKKLCNSGREASKKLGTINAKQLQLRLAQLLSVNKLDDFSFDNPHPLQGDRLGEFSVGLQSGLRIVFKAVEPIPKTKDSATDWKNVKAIIIIFIGDYHE